MSYRFKFVLHIALVFAAFVSAYALRRGLGLEWWLTDEMAPLVLTWAGMYAAVAAVMEIVFRTERTAWRFSSFSDVVRLAQTAGLTALAFLAIIFLSNRAITLPRSTLVLSWLLCVFGLSGVRLAWRLAADPRQFRSLLLVPRRRRAVNARPLLLVGNVVEAEAYLRRHATGVDRDYAPLAILAPHKGLLGQLVQGVPVRGVVGDLEDVVRATTGAGKAILFLDDPILALGIPTEVIGRLRTSGVQLLRKPNLVELKQGGSEALREIKVEEFLPREPISLDLTSVQAFIHGKRVLVTGAGGSIGSELCRQLVSFGCAHLTMVDHSEFLLFEAEHEIAALQGDEGTRTALLCNVRDDVRVRAVFEAERPEVVFHAAALKHVTLVENNPCEGVLTNIKGTLHVMEASKTVGARQVVLISTDKAVDPTSVMGATKRIAEYILPAATESTRFSAVRFGNVLGSAGSVVPLFRSQIERGGPVTLTHEDVERYFMTIPEAVQLVLHATALNAADDQVEPRKFILEMGRPVKIRELAERMIDVSGLKAGKDIQIEVTGLKPGEKLSERLIDAGEMVVGSTGLVSEIRSVTQRQGKLEAVVGPLIAAAETGDAKKTVAMLRQLVSVARGGREVRKAAEEQAA